MSEQEQKDKAEKVKEEWDRMKEKEAKKREKEAAARKDGVSIIKHRTLCRLGKKCESLKVVFKADELIASLEQKIEEQIEENFNFQKFHNEKKEEWLKVVKERDDLIQRLRALAEANREERRERERASQEEALRVSRNLVQTGQEFIVKPSTLNLKELSDQLANLQTEREKLLVVNRELMDRINVRERQLVHGLGVPDAKGKVVPPQTKDNKKGMLAGFLMPTTEDVIKSFDFRTRQAEEDKKVAVAKLQETEMMLKKILNEKEEEERNRFLKVFNTVGCQADIVMVDQETQTKSTASISFIVKFQRAYLRKWHLNFAKTVRRISAIRERVKSSSSVSKKEQSLNTVECQTMVIITKDKSTQATPQLTHSGLVKFQRNYLLRWHYNYVKAVNKLVLIRERTRKRFTPLECFRMYCDVLTAKEDVGTQTREVLIVDHYSEFKRNLEATRKKLVEDNIRPFREDLRKSISMAANWKTRLHAKERKNASDRGRNTLRSYGAEIRKKHFRKWAITMLRLYRLLLVFKFKAEAEAKKDEQIEPPTFDLSNMHSSLTAVHDDVQHLKSRLLQIDEDILASHRSTNDNTMELLSGLNNKQLDFNDLLKRSQEETHTTQTSIDTLRDEVLTFMIESKAEIAAVKKENSKIQSNLSELRLVNSELENSMSTSKLAVITSNKQIETLMLGFDGLKMSINSILPLEKPKEPEHLSMEKSEKNEGDGVTQKLSLADIMKSISIVESDVQTLKLNIGSETEIKKCREAIEILKVDFEHVNGLNMRTKLDIVDRDINKFYKAIPDLEHRTQTLEILLADQANAISNAQRLFSDLKSVTTVQMSQLAAAKRVEANSELIAINEMRRSGKGKKAAKLDVAAQNLKSNKPADVKEQCLQLSSSISDAWQRSLANSVYYSLLESWSQKPYLSPERQMPYTDLMSQDEWSWQKNRNSEIYYRGLRRTINLIK